MSFCYLATPHSKHPRGIEAAFREACLTAAACFLAGVNVYSPIAHTHPIASFGGMDGALDTWSAFDLEMIRISRAVIVVRMDGWEDSIGIAREAAFAEEIGVPVHFMDPDGPVPDEVLP